MQIVLNGKLQTLEHISTVADLVAHLQLENKRLAVEINEEILPRSQFSTHQINDGDSIELVHAIGGG